MRRTALQSQARNCAICFGGLPHFFVLSVFSVISVYSVRISLLLAFANMKIVFQIKKASSSEKKPRNITKIKFYEILPKIHAPAILSTKGYT